MDLCKGWHIKLHFSPLPDVDVLKLWKRGVSPFPSKFQESQDKIFFSPFLSILVYLWWRMSPRLYRDSVLYIIWVFLSFLWLISINYHAYGQNLSHTDASLFCTPTNSSQYGMSCQQRWDDKTIRINWILFLGSFLPQEREEEGRWEFDWLSKLAKWRLKNRCWEVKVVLFVPVASSAQVTYHLRWITCSWSMMSRLLPERGVELSRRNGGHHRGGNFELFSTFIRYFLMSR